jgi:hypothetical protein
MSEVMKQALTDKNARDSETMLPQANENAPWL